MLSFRSDRVLLDYSVFVLESVETTKRSSLCARYQTKSEGMIPHGASGWAGKGCLCSCLCACLSLCCYTACLSTVRGSDLEIGSTTNKADSHRADAAENKTGDILLNLEEGSGRM